MNTKKGIEMTTLVAVQFCLVGTSDWIACYVNGELVANEHGDTTAQLLCARLAEAHCIEVLPVLYVTVAHLNNARKGWGYPDRLEDLKRRIEEMRLDPAQ